MLDGIQIGHIYPQTMYCSHTVQASRSHQIIIQHGQTETPLPLQQGLAKASAPHAEDSSDKWCNLRRLSLKQQRLSWTLRNANNRIGSMRMMNASLSCYMRRTRPIWSDKMTLAPNPRQTNSNISEDKPRRDCTR